MWSLTLSLYTYALSASAPSPKTPHRCSDTAPATNRTPPTPPTIQTSTSDDESSAMDDLKVEVLFENGAYYEVSLSWVWKVLASATASAIIADPGDFPRRIGGVLQDLQSPLRPCSNKYFYPLFLFPFLPFIWEVHATGWKQVAAWCVLYF